MFPNFCSGINILELLFPNSQFSRVVRSLRTTRENYWGKACAFRKLGVGFQKQAQAHTGGRLARFENWG